MVRLLAVVMAAAVFSAVSCKPLEDMRIDHKVRHMWKRFISTALAPGTFDDNNLYKMRTKRSAGEDCERLQLCKLHARSSRNFFAAYELYFVNKENAKLWDHQTHSIADCESRFSGCHGDAPRKLNSERTDADSDTYRYRTFRNEEDDYNY